MQKKQSTACAFISTSFGFGPVSKAVSIAQELKAQVPDITTHYFGAGIDYSFAKKSEAFDEIFEFDVDKKNVLVELLQRLSQYQAIFSVLNLDILPLWRTDYCPLYFVDSLAWMWSNLPIGLDNVETYFVQDYLMSNSRLLHWREKVQIKLVAPIETASIHKLKNPIIRSNQLLVNFSGCYNPFTEAKIFEKYVQVLTTAILDEALRSYDRIIFCCNENLANYLQIKLKNVPNVSVGHFAHDEFLQLLGSSQRILSTPGITTTLEAMMLDTHIGFLLPQNYSQSLMSEHYRTSLGESACMAFSQFGSEFSIEPSLPEEEGVKLVVSNLQTILVTRQQEIRSLVSKLLSIPKENILEKLKTNIANRWHEPGQQSIVAHFLAAQKD